MMLLLLLSLFLLLAAATVNAEGNPFTPRIVNGDTANTAEYPYFAVSGEGSFFLASESRCGATLIHPDILLSAAHCQGAFHYETFLYNENRGDYSRQVQIDEQRRYPAYNYNNSNLNFDIMVMRLSQPVYDISPLPIINADPDIPTTMEELFAVGFGVTQYEGDSPSTLQEARFQALTQEVCQDRVDSYGLQGANFTHGDILCVDSSPTDDASVCGGDSGGPLVTADKQTLVGVTSFSAQCEDDSIPDGFARVSFFGEWINEQVCDMSRDPPLNCPPAPTPHPNAVTVRTVWSFDWDAHEITYAIRHVASQQIVYAGPRFVASQASDEEETLTLLPGEYVMEVYDTFKGDGLQCPDWTGLTCGIFPDGYWELYADYGSGEVLVASGDANFEREQLTEFRIEGDTIVPTTAPTTTTSTEAPTTIADSNHQNTTNMTVPMDDDIDDDDLLVSPDKNITVTTSKNGQSTTTALLEGDEAGYKEPYETDGVFNHTTGGDNQDDDDGDDFFDKSGAMTFSPYSSLAMTTMMVVILVDKAAA